MTTINITPARAKLLRAVQAGVVRESRDGALQRSVRIRRESVRLAQTGALEEAGLIRLEGGRPDWKAGPYSGRPFELTEAGRVWLAEHDTTTKD